jgi:hypothetical protein
VTARLVLCAESRGWILEKFANRLVENLAGWGVKADISDHTSPSADIHHWLLYRSGPERRVGPCTMLITHVDRLRSMRKVFETLEHVNAGICLSQMTIRQLVEFGVPARKLCYIVPGCDLAANPRRIVVAISSRVYPDGRKREDLLVRVAQAMRLDWFHFDIVGRGWDPIIPELEKAGATVDYYGGSDDFVADYRLGLDRLSRADFYLYTGLDEGSMGYLDALSAGVATIVTPQGFHLDVKDGITHSFTDEADLHAIFQKLAEAPQRRREAARALSWNEYAREHAVVWRAILAGNTVDHLQLLRPLVAAEMDLTPSSRWLRSARWGKLALDNGRRVGRSLISRARRL